MQIIKNKQLTENHWTFIADDEALKSGNISITLDRWKREQDKLQEHAGAVGIRLKTTDDVAELADVLDSIELIELDFPAFTDGRAFSQARMLRGKYHYQGEIRACGCFIVDQLYYLSRVGVNAFVLNSERDLQQGLLALNDFSVNYQVSTN